MRAGVLIVVQIQMRGETTQFFPGTARTRLSIEIINRILDFSIGAN